MNQVIATVQNIEETDIVTYIHVNSGESAMYLIKSEKPKWLSVGDKVYCNFQEGSVCLSKDCPGNLPGLPCSFGARHARNPFFRALLCDDRPPRPPCPDRVHRHRLHVFGRLMIAHAIPLGAFIRP